MARENGAPADATRRGLGSFQLSAEVSSISNAGSDGKGPDLKLEQRALVLSHAGKLPSTYMAAKRALAECDRVDQCKDWADKHAALASYAKQSKDDELFDLATRIRARASRRMSELLKEIEPQKGSRTDLGDSPPLSRKAAGDAVGLSADQRKDAIRVANVPEDEFEQLVEGSNPPTVTKLAEIGTKHKPAPKPDPKYAARPMPKPKSGKPVVGLDAARQFYLGKCAEPGLREIAGKRAMMERPQ
jgi:hypothetical protein